MSATTEPPGYAFPRRALRRWQAEQLTLSTTPDGGHTALFRLEGSTCGNVPFELHYRVRLGPAAEGHRLLGFFCALAAHDTNHREQCAAKADYGDHRASVAVPPPLHGRPLAEALAWSPATAPDGCLCTEPARAHKWRAVLQTIHFALHSSTHENTALP